MYHILSLFWLSDPLPDPDLKAEHNPDAPPLGEHCAQVWFKSIQPSWRSSIFSQLWTTDGQTPQYDNTSYGLWPDELKSLRMYGVPIYYYFNFTEIPTI